MPRRNHFMKLKLAWPLARTRMRGNRPLM
ncbi:hypothetical protein ACHAWF_006457 [Thalassiosira exigua]